MKMDNLLSVTSREGLRVWLQENGNSEKSCWVVVSLTLQPDTILYLDAVEECLCFGWIDGLKKKISQTEMAQRLSPRSKKSSWTELNKERVRRLEKLGLMMNEGRKVLPDINPDSFVIDQIIDSRLKEDKRVYNNFLAFPALYQRIRIDTIQSVRNEPDLYNSRLVKLLAHTKKNKMYGQWHDNGRLLDY